VPEVAEVPVDEVDFHAVDEAHHEDEEASVIGEAEAGPEGLEGVVEGFKLRVVPQEVVAEDSRRGVVDIKCSFHLQDYGWRLGVGIGRSARLLMFGPLLKFGLLGLGLAVFTF